MGSVIWPELNTVSTRAINPFKIEPEVARRLSREIFPYWMRRSIQEVARYSDYDTDDYPDRDEVEGASLEPPLKKKAGETPRCQQLYERVAFYIAFIASCVSHTVPDFNRLVKFGFFLKPLLLNHHPALFKLSESFIKFNLYVLNRFFVSVFGGDIMRPRVNSCLFDRSYCRPF